MKKYSQKALKKLVQVGLADDLSTYSEEQLAAFDKLQSVGKVGYSVGVYGINGCLLKDTATGDLYAITSRNSLLFRYV